MTISMDTKYGLSLERLRSLLIYDPNTGVFTRKETGETAGYTQEGKGNYRRIIATRAHQDAKILHPWPAPVVLPPKLSMIIARAASVAHRMSAWVS